MEFITKTGLNNHLKKDNTPCGRILANEENGPGANNIVCPVYGCTSRSEFSFQKTCWNSCIFRWTTYLELAVHVDCAHRDLVCPSEIFMIRRKTFPDKATFLVSLPFSCRFPRFNKCFLFRNGRKQWRKRQHRNSFFVHLKKWISPYEHFSTNVSARILVDKRNERVSSVQHSSSAVREITDSLKSSHASDIWDMSIRLKHQKLLSSDIWLIRRGVM